MNRLRPPRSVAGAATSPVKVSRNGSGSRGSGTCRRLCPCDASVAVKLALTRHHGRVRLASGLDAVAPAPFGRKQGVVCSTEEPAVADLAARTSGHASGDRHLEAAWTGPGDRMAHPFGHVHGLGQCHAGQQDQELLATQPVDQIEGAQLLAQEIGDVPEDGVAGG